MRKKHNYKICQCASCKSVRGEYNGKKNPYYGKKHSMKWKKAQKDRKLKLFKDAKKHPRYKGKVKNDAGYILIYSSNHPYKDKHNRVREHRLEMEKHLGKKTFICKFCKKNQKRRKSK